MYESINDYLANIEGAIRISNDETAFPMKTVQKVFDTISKKQWIILGGDVLTLEFEYTYDNWYYEPDSKTSLLDNVLKSIRKSDQYISNYMKVHGDHHWVVFTISCSYIEGRK